MYTQFSAYFFAFNYTKGTSHGSAALALREISSLFQRDIFKWQNVIFESSRKMALVLYNNLYAKEAPPLFELMEVTNFLVLQVFEQNLPNQGSNDLIL